MESAVIIPFPKPIQTQAAILLREAQEIYARSHILLLEAIDLQMVILRSFLQ